MNFLYFSKRILFAVMAVSFALFIGFHLLQARSNEELEQSLDEMATLAVESQDYDQDGVPDLEDEEREAALIWLSSPLARALFREPHQGGDVFVYLSMGRLYGVDEGGRILALKADQEHLDAPLLAGDGLKVDMKKKRLAGRGFEEAIQFLRELKNENGTVHQRVSEIFVSRKSGIICYYNWADLIPIVIGHGLIRQKVKSLDVFFDQLTNTGLLDNTQYLDARLGDRIVLKRTS